MTQKENFNSDSIKERLGKKLKIRIGWIIQRHRESKCKNWQGTQQPGKNQKAVIHCLLKVDIEGKFKKWWGTGQERIEK